MTDGTHSRNGDFDRSHNLSERNEGRTSGHPVRLLRGQVLASGTFSGNGSHVGLGEVACSECYSDPAQYLADVGLTCPLCLGVGSHPDHSEPHSDDVEYANSLHREFGSSRPFSRRV